MFYDEEHRMASALRAFYGMYRRQCAGLFTCKAQQFIRNDLVKCIGWLAEQKQCQNVLHGM